MNIRATLPITALMTLQGIAHGQAQETRPNIVLIMADDHAANAISAYHGGLSSTPNIDRIAENGIRFTNCFSTNAISGPSRASILSGQFSHIHGVINNNVRCDSSLSILPAVFQQHQYQTSIFGKWHLSCEPAGFDTWKILPGQGEYYNPDFIENGSGNRHEGYVTDLITDMALEWLEQRDTTRPFVVMIHHKAPHRPWLPHPDHVSLFDTADIPLPFNFFDDHKDRASAARQQELSVLRDLELSYDLKYPPDKAGKANFGRLNLESQRYFDSAYAHRNTGFETMSADTTALAEWKFRRYINDYLATIHAVDLNVGRVLDWLRAEGLDSNTIVIYTSDQGFFLGEHGWYDKRFMYEESMRMPLLISWPEKLTAGKSNDQLLMNIDLAPTLMEWAGLSIPTEVQGRSFAHYSDTAGRFRDALYYHYFEYPEPHRVEPHYGIRTDRYKLIRFYTYPGLEEWELYDLLHDPYEMFNLYRKEEYNQIVKVLKVRLDELRNEYSDTLSALKHPTITIQNRIRDREYFIANMPSERYAGDGPLPLTDGVIEHPEFSGGGIPGSWVGFHGTDLNVYFETKKRTKVREIEVRLLHLEGSWIFEPTDVTVMVPKGIRKIAFLEPSRTIRETRPTGGEVVRVIFEPKKSRRRGYIIVAINQRVCPEGHPGEGNPAWLFVDEIIVR